MQRPVCIGNVRFGSNILEDRHVQVLHAKDLHLVTIAKQVHDLSAAAGGVLLRFACHEARGLLRARDDVGQRPGQAAAEVRPHLAPVAGFHGRQ